MIDMVGKTFGFLKVIEKSHMIRKDKNHREIYWLCQCNCGSTTIVNGRSLRSGDTKSCGCYRKSFRKTSEPKMVSAYCVYKHPRKYSKSLTRSYSEADITFEKFVELSQKPCHYCGAGPSNKVNKIPKDRKNYDDYWFIYNGLDRVDSSKPHTIENCVPCCFACNYAKRDMTVQQFFDWLERAYNHSIKPTKNSNQAA